ncbi:hypothetical protein [Kineosporia succinea]|uniref:DUF2690 domain-containing protein n=1 Tax=Kineosporia succinea TaxID=84632 RepID=A0ABT9PA31_9ACTN|nr:hypothetical protein [Kineosporia succinea]MDP9829552.1 hypothetical protein [Kineosporia succinea]
MSFVLALLTLGLGALIAEPAQAVGCNNGDRGQAASWASSGQFTTPRVYEWNDGTAHNKVELRYNSAARCVWGLYNGGNSATVYLDQSTNGGASWVGWIGAQGPSTSTYTGVWNDQNPTVSRACANYGGISRCTGWY